VLCFVFNALERSVFVLMVLGRCMMCHLKSTKVCGAVIDGAVGGLCFCRNIWCNNPPTPSLQEEVREKVARRQGREHDIPGELSDNAYNRRAFSSLFSVLAVK
jgi:hypothetical protein